MALPTEIIESKYKLLAHVLGVIWGWILAAGAIKLAAETLPNLLK